MNSVRSLLLFGGLSLFALSIRAQGLSIPSLNPSEPVELGRTSTQLYERLDTRKWRRKYNLYEVSVLIWQLYRATKEKGDWKEIFGSLEDLLDDENRQHEAYYAGLRGANKMVSSYHIIVDIRNDFSAIVRYGQEVATTLDDPAIWTDEAQRDYILAISLEIKKRALGTLRYLPLIAGISSDEVTELSEHATASIQESYWASTADRLAHLDRMHGELGALRSTMKDLYYLVHSVRLGREGQHTDQSAGQLLFGTN